MDLVLGGVNALVNANTLIVRGHIYSFTTFLYIGKLEVDTRGLKATCQASN